MRDLTRTSKRLAYYLRHGTPQEVTRDPQGWVACSQVRSLLGVNQETLEALVAGDAKGRYELDPHRQRVRALQGHSQPVAISHEVLPPPEVLFHGTKAAALAGIFTEGLLSQGRHAVHLSSTAEAAWQVAARRRGTSVLLRVDAARAHREGVEFQRTANGVWLAAALPPTYLTPLYSEGEVHELQ